LTRAYFAAGVASKSLCDPKTGFAVALKAIPFSQGKPHLGFICGYKSLFTQQQLGKKLIYHDGRKILWLQILGFVSAREKCGRSWRKSQDLLREKRALLHSQNSPPEFCFLRRWSHNN
jgi:hypothetical protein